MSFVIRRSVSTLVPPKVTSILHGCNEYELTDIVQVANPSGLGAAKNAQRMAKIAKFYEQLPKGPAPNRAPGGPLGWYQAKYFGKNPSAAPIWHVIFGIMALGYSMEYYFHLRHHKNNAH
ncbi:F-type H+-transporting ATPase subunit F [Exophiala viscosa]|uniref:F-type H+-transporting ATPase subunit F n=1 Tax=Exophiala viscosa TaxID=2486360 RepID=A0AAN6IAU6_9EURO|nr:F-type H+-transporting ATPase subunit F [Exophiala viscosa]KAI1624451.1 F-type H+-transporting ATPase subunit F [Exophiala viscosa]